MTTRKKSAAGKRDTSRLAFHPLTPGRWKDLELLFGPRGACAGCWCMWWRLSRAQFARQKGAKNKKAFHNLVRSGCVPGILAYAGREPVGWCAVEPRKNYPSLERSRVLRRVDDKPVWSVTCFFIAKSHRRRGVSSQLLKAAVAHVRTRGGTIIEGYPVEPKTRQMPEVFAWTGFASAFRHAGFKECLRRSKTRPIMRCKIK